MRPILYLIASFLTASICAQSNPTTITYKDLTAIDKGLVGMSYENKIKISNDITLNLFMETTTKGNGIMYLGKQGLRVYDYHDDGEYFDKGMLKMRFIDINDDGYLDLLLTGTLLITGEKGDKIISKKPVIFIYQFDASSKRFKSIYANDDYNLAFGDRPW